MEIYLLQFCQLNWYYTIQEQDFCLVWIHIYFQNQFFILCFQMLSDVCHTDLDLEQFLQVIIFFILDLLWLKRSLFLFICNLYQYFHIILDLGFYLLWNYAFLLLIIFYHKWKVFSYNKLQALDEQFQQYVRPHVFLLYLM